MTRRQLLGAVLAGPVASRLAVTVSAGQKLPKGPSRENIKQYGVHLRGPLPTPYGGKYHLEHVVLPGLISIRDLIERDRKGRPIRFLEPEMPKAIEYCRLYAIGPMRVREAWAWDPWPYDGSAPHFVGRLDAIVQIG